MESFQKIRGVCSKYMIKEVAKGSASESSKRHEMYFFKNV